ncbi:ATP-binding protein [Desulfopila aestuarii]|uniref:histidine kinase n=1 Tax=Desulfopila aestuarii DSM 18488 TaxID=1121416 RepID=A0A1M7YBF7_9BACT|nr:ATP-binding protein [Desulfopila aestuarii]SHO49931.1 two-component system, OmpR family, sensor histidine kinase BaeS [Desulfopila aestuarii DSM 18488]
MQTPKGIHHRPWIFLFLGKTHLNLGIDVRLQIRHKLFLTLLITSVAVAAVLFFFLQWSFDRGFLNYVKNQEIEQIQRLASKLTLYYAEHENWKFMENNHKLWVRTVTESDPLSRRLHNSGPVRALPAIGKEKGAPDRRMRPESSLHPAPPPNDGKIFGPRVALFDSNKKWMIGGPPGGVDNFVMHPFQYKGNIIGYLGLMPLQELSDSGDLRFVEQQKESFVLVTLIMVVFSLLLAYPLTSHLLRPIKALSAGTDKLIAGVFKTRIGVSSGDELGRLSEHFNILAMTLEKNEEARRQWVADISHELRTPLAVLRGEVEAMQDGVRKLEPKNIEGLHGEILHLERLVGDLYELSMSDIGALNYKRTDLNPLGILQGTLEMFETRFSNKGLVILPYLLSDFDRSMLGDPDRLQQLFTNLLENSLRYTDAPGRLEIRMVATKEGIQITFEDSKPGVGDKQLPKLFDRLYRLDSSRNRKSGGAGLGLAICKNIAEAHQGSIAAYPSPLGGLKITIDLPLHS